MDDVDRAIEEVRVLLADGKTRWTDGTLISVSLAWLVATKRLTEAIELLHKGLEYDCSFRVWGPLTK